MHLVHVTSSIGRKGLSSGVAAIGKDDLAVVAVHFEVHKNQLSLFITTNIY